MLHRKKSSPLELLQSGGAASTVVSSALFLLYGTWCSLSSYLQGAQLWDGAGWVIFGGLGLFDVAKSASKRDPDWEYTMEEVEMQASSPITPQVSMQEICGIQ